MQAVQPGAYLPEERQAAVHLRRCTFFALGQELRKVTAAHPLHHDSLMWRCANAKHADAIWMLYVVHHARFLNKLRVVDVDNFLHCNMRALPKALADFTAKKSFFRRKVCVWNEITAEDDCTVSQGIYGGAASRLVCNIAHLDH